MKKVVLFIALLAVSGFALADTSSVTITVVNNSNTAISFIGAYDTNPTNVISVTPDVLPPHGGTATITGTTTLGYDLVGTLLFKSASEQPYTILLLDPRGYYSGQFGFSTDQFKKKITSLTINKDPHQPMYLFYTKATVELGEK